MTTTTGARVGGRSRSLARRDPAGLVRARRRAAVLGWALLGVATVLLVSLLASRSHPWFQPVDRWWERTVVTHRTPWATTLARFLSVVGSARVTIPVRLAVVVVLVARRRWVQLGAFATAIAASELCVGLVKAVVGRARPPLPLVAATGSSFPSGHAIATAVTAFGIVAAFLPRGRRRWHWFVAATILAATMAWSRTYLSVHWASDTIGGTCIGVGIALLVETAFEASRWMVRVTNDDEIEGADPP